MSSQAVNDLRRSAERNSGRGMKLSTRTSTLREVFAALDEQTARAEAAEAKVPSRGKTKELTEHRDALASLVRTLAAVIEDGDDCGENAVDAVRGWAARMDYPDVDGLAGLLGDTLAGQ